MAASGSAGGAATPVSAAGSAAPGKAAPRPAALCAEVSQVSRLVILRSRATARIQVLHFPFPGQVVVTNAVSARAVATAVCALPRMPAGVLHCPAMLVGTSYQLSFTAAGRKLPVVTVQATGCQAVTGAGPVRRAATAPGFWRVLGNALGLYSAGPTVFSGNGPRLTQCQPTAIRGAQINGCPAMMRPLSGTGPVS